MAKVNPELEQLRRENAFLKGQLERLRADPPEIPFLACDNSCDVARPTGMATNGGCRCDEQKLRRAVRYWREVAQHRLAAIEILKERGCPTSDVPNE